MAHVIGKLERCISIRDIVSTIFTIPEVTQLITLKHYQNFKLLSLFSNKLLRTKARHTDTFFLLYEVLRNLFRNLWKIASWGLSVLRIIHCVLIGMLTYV